MIKQVLANGVVVDVIDVPETYTEEDYREDCRRNGWEFAPCDEDAEIELVNYGLYAKCAREQYKIGDCFFDDHNGRYLTIDGFDCDTKVAECIVEELNDDGDLEITGKQLFSVFELVFFIRR